MSAKLWDHAASMQYAMILKVRTRAPVKMATQEMDWLVKVIAKLFDQICIKS